MEELIKRAKNLAKEPFKPDGDPSLPSLRTVAAELGTSVIRTRKLLITAGYFESQTVSTVQKLSSAGKSIEEIGEELHLKAYSDEKSGTKAENRAGFQKLIRDALDGKVDYILVKSISRFSRNIVDCQRYVKLLHGNGVEVRFEKENLDTGNPSCTMMLSFLSAIAQDESRSISENVKWAYRERFKRGEYNLGNNRVLGYDSVDGKLVPNQDADGVRAIYELYLEGNSIEEIRRILADIGVVTKKGTPLSHHNILYILQNETYRGDKLLQKQPPKDFLTKKPDRSKHYESNYLKDDHEAIVEPKVWDAVQEKIKQNMDLMEAVGHLGGRPHFLYGKVFCAACGSPMMRRTFTGYKGVKYKAWVCRDRHLGRNGNGCRMRIEYSALRKPAVRRFGNRRSGDLETVIPAKWKPPRSVV